MSRPTLVVIVILLACIAAAVAQCKPSKAEQRIFYLLNQERELAGLEKLTWNEEAAQAARAHATLLAEHRELSHQFAGEPPLRKRLTSNMVRFTSAAENVALADNEDEAHLALMYSQGHRENILNKDYSAAGIGVVEDHGRLYVAEDFIRLVPAYSEEQFEQAFSRALNGARTARRLKPVTTKRDAALHNAACSTQGNASAVPVGSGFAGELVVFSLSEPEQLPEQLLTRVLDTRLHSINVGVCFRPDAEHGNGNFWVVAELPN